LEKETIEMPVDEICVENAIISYKKSYPISKVIKCHLISVGIPTHFCTCRDNILRVE